MLRKLAGGRVYDPVNGIDGEVRDLYVRDGRIVDPPGSGEPVDEEIDLTGQVVMAGGIDLHTHISGGKVNLARQMLPEDHAAHPRSRTETCRSGSGRIVPSTWATGYRYAELGYTTAIDPAVIPANARHTHLEGADTPMLDTGGFAMLGNDDYFLRLLATGTEQAEINDYVAWMLQATQCLGVKVVNPGGISAFKFNQRRLDPDEAHSHYGITPRAVLRTLTRSLHELGVPKPLHVHTSNLGIPGNYRSTLTTMEAAEGLPIHLTHLQFHSYGTEGDRGFSSAAPHLAEAINGSDNVTVDVGQVMFGQTVTTSGDTMRQFANRANADPSKSSLMDIECEAGCGVVPFHYQDDSFVHALQWLIGLELFLLIEDPWKVTLTTDHPNGAPFTTYPHLIRLLMDAGFRRRSLEALNPAARKASILEGLDREYSLYEVAVITRAGPARLLGLRDRGHLGTGAAADLAVYADDPDRERMFSEPVLVLKDGEPVVRQGRLLRPVAGRVHAVHPDYDPSVEGKLADYFDRYLGIRPQHYRIDDEELAEEGGVELHPCRERQA